MKVLLMAVVVALQGTVQGGSSYKNRTRKRVVDFFKSLGRPKSPGPNEPDGPWPIKRWRGHSDTGHSNAQNFDASPTNTWYGSAATSFGKRSMRSGETGLQVADSAESIVSGKRRTSTALSSIPLPPPLPPPPPPLPRSLASGQLSNHEPKAPPRPKAWARKIKPEILPKLEASASPQSLLMEDIRRRGKSLKKVPKPQASASPQSLLMEDIRRRGKSLKKVLKPEASASPQSLLMEDIIRRGKSLKKVQVATKTNLQQPGHLQTALSRQIQQKQERGLLSPKREKSISELMQDRRNAIAPSDDNEDEEWD